MIRYVGRTDHQTKVLFREGAHVQQITSERFYHAIYRRLCFQRFFTHHQVDRVTTKQFLAMLAVARLRQYEKKAA